MKRKMIFGVCTAVVLSGLVSSGLAELPDFYKRVDRVIWVVDDLDSVIRGWERLGFPSIQKHGEIRLENAKLRNKAGDVTLLAATGRIGQVKIDWLEPIGEESIFSKFLSENGAGVFALVHQVPTLDALELELLRYENLGVGTLLNGVSSSPTKWGHYSFLDTRPRGRIVLGLFCNPDTSTEAPVFSKEVPFDQEIVQWAFAIKDPEPISKFWSYLDFPPFSIVPVDGREREYRGRPAEFEMNLGWQRHGEVAYEWCIPLKGPTVYQDHIDEHGEGFHHIGLRVQDLDATIDKWKALGIPVIQSGAWGEKGKPGSGRYAYMDTGPIGGIAVELLWSFQN